MTTSQEQLVALVSALSSKGFTENPSSGAQELADAAGLSRNGPYTVKAHLSHADGSSVLVEQNVSPDLGDDSELSSLVTHPTLVVLTAHSGSAVAIKLSEGPDAILAVLADLR